MPKPTIIVSFSGLGENSLTLKSLEVLEHCKEAGVFQKLIIKPTYNFAEISEAIEKIQKADIVIWAVSPFHMNVPSHMIRFFEECRARGVCFDNINTFFTTNMRVCDNFLSAGLEQQIKSVAKYYIQGLSYATPDMINRKMSLYNLASPDEPPKKKRLIFQSPKFKYGEGLENAVKWYNLLQTASCVIYGKKIAPAPKNVVFVDMDNTPEKSAFVSEAVSQFKKAYLVNNFTVTDIAQRDYRVSACDGCKLCYASKKCKFKDDFTKYEEALEKADIIIYYGKCEFGMTSSLDKKMTDRDVKNGLMPKNAVLPDNMPKFQAIGYIIDANPESYAMFREYKFAMTSFSFKHYIGCFAQHNTTYDNLKTAILYSILITEDRILPARNFYSEKIGKHFSDLSQNIPSVIPEEVKYYKKAGGYEPVKMDKNARTVMPDTFQIGIKARQIPYEKVMEMIDKSNLE